MAAVLTHETVEQHVMPRTGTRHRAPKHRRGDLVGVRLSFGVADESCFADAQFRHAQVDGEALMLGFQFVGLAHSRPGRAALKLITVKVAELHRLQAKLQQRAAS